MPSGFQGDGGPAVGAQFSNPRGLAVDGSGNVFVADEVNNRIREVSPAGTISTSAGDGQELPDSGDGGPAASAVIPYPVAVMLDSQGSMYIAEASGAIRRINAQGIISTFATFAGVPDFIVITSATLDGWGDVYASDYLTRVWKADASGTISAVAGGASAGFSGDGGPAMNALLNFPLAIVVDNAGNLFIADEQNFRIRKISPDGTIFTIAGIGQSAYSGNGGPASAAALIDPQALAIRGNNLLVGDGGIYLREISGTVNFNIFDPGTFVNQLYEDLLGRAADPSGLAFWSGQLNDGNRSRSQVAQQFFDSPEFHDNGLLVIKDYVAALGRDPDYAGWTWWVTQLESKAETSDQVLASFLASAEFQTAYGNLDNTQFVMLVYQNVLQRQPDVNGLDYWTGQLDGGQTREWVMAQFIASPEFNNLIANRALANLLYLGFLRRSADPAGLQYWQQQLASGQPQASVINGIIGSPEYLSRF